MSVESFAPRKQISPQSALIAGNPIGWSDRLLGDAASQLCEPLARITDSIAGVIGTDAGQLTDEQRESLHDAMAACDQIDKIVAGLRRLNRRREHGEVRRRWVELSSLKTEAERLIRHQLPHRRDAIRWHGFDSTRRVYADPTIACRLLAGLVGSAMRHAGSPMVGGKAILVRAHCLGDRQILRLSVSVEDGCFFGGRGGAHVGNIVNEKEDWVELAVWRSLAAALMAHPEIVMRPNGGWEIGLDLPSDSPTGVANQWSRWRLAQHASSRSSQAGRSATAPRVAGAGGSQAHQPGGDVNRLLCGMMSANVGPGPIHPSQAAIFTIVAGAAVAPDAVDAFNRKLESDLGMYDLAYRISTRRWLIVWDVDATQARTRIETLAAGSIDSASPIRLQWSSIGVLPIRDGQTARILSDRIARELLTDTESGHAAVDQTADATDLRPSTVPSDRLMAEMRHLAERVRAQNEHLIGQARQLRPAMRDNR